MTKILRRTLFLLLILTLTLLMLILLKEDRKPIKIEPIKIVSNQEKPLDILSKLEVATKVSTERLTSSEEVSNKVLESLKETIAQQQR